ncbi:MAG TPA: hypothetical protein VI413_09710, partial [Paludibacter sp.]
TKLPMFLTLVLICSVQISAQDVIFKRTGELVKAKILNQIGSAISYRYYDNRDSLTYYISTSIIDSIIYQSGTKDIFTKSAIVESHSFEPLTPVYKHSLIGVDLADILLFSKIGVSYEYLPGKMTVGFKAAFEKDLKNLYYYSTDSNNGFTNWNLQLGVDFYIFPPRTFRLGAGLHYVFTQYNYSDYIGSTYVNTIKNAHGVMLTLFGFYNLNKNWAVNFGFDIPFSNISYQYSLPSWIKCEIMYNF